MELEDPGQATESSAAESMDMDLVCSENDQDPTDMVIVNIPSINTDDDDNHVMVDAGVEVSSDSSFTGLNAIGFPANHNGPVGGSWYFVPCSRASNGVHAIWIV